jgi:hypothetical protein
LHACRSTIRSAGALRLHAQNDDVTALVLRYGGKIA